MRVLGPVWRVSGSGGLVKEGRSDAEEVEGAKAEREKDGESIKPSSSTKCAANSREDIDDEESVDGKLKDSDGESRAGEVGRDIGIM